MAADVDTGGAIVPIADGEPVLRREGRAVELAFAVAAGGFLAAPPGVAHSFGAPVLTGSERS
jgi:hypothetical protein